MKCPNCSAAGADGAAECPACGLVFAKWRERREKEKLAAAEALKALESPPPARENNPWIGRLIAALLVAWWLIGFAIYFMRRFPVSRPFEETRSGPSESGPGAR